MCHQRLRTAVIVPVAEAARVVDDWRERTCDAKPSAGVPPHITLLFPFVGADEVDSALVDSLQGLLGRHGSFSFSLSTTGRFPAALYLAPDPAEPFVRLSEDITAHYERYRPYGGAFGSLVPHLTVAQGVETLLEEAEAAVRPHLPIGAEAREALLLEEVAENGGRWEVRAHLPFNRHRP